MSGKRSFETINYMLRPNKNVERKLILSSLQRMAGQFPIASYRYVGFGSMWFSDFVLMHKALGISDMVTIEKEKSREKRVEFNKPFACIAVRMEEAATALGDVLDDTPSIVWLDYDGPLKRALTGDIETAVGSMSSSSMILVTVNAMVEQLKGNVVDGETLSAENFLADICDDKGMATKGALLTRNDFPALAAEIVHKRIKAAVLEKKPGCHYAPIWSYRYADAAEMITVGGMIVDATDTATLNACALGDLAHITGETLFDIELPVLTEREKRSLDKRLPCAVPLDPASLEFELRLNEVQAYQRFYLEYPIFGEMAA